MERKKVLITGANGFVGSNLTKYLSQKEEYQIFAMVRSLESISFLLDFQKDPKSGKNLFEIVLANLLDEDSLNNVMKGMDVVIHLAGLVSDWGDWEIFFRMNVTGTELILKSASNEGVKRVLYLSTLAVHQMVGHIETDEEVKHPIRNFPYGETKRMAEDLVLNWSTKKGRSAVVIRPGWLIYGPYDKNTFVNVLDAIKSGTFGLIDGGNKLISHVYVGNLCSGMEKLIQNMEKEGVYNILDGNMSWSEWSKIWTNALGAKTPKYSIPYLILYPLIFPLVFMLELIFKMFKSKNSPGLTPYVLDIMHRDLSFSNKKFEDELAFKAPFTMDRAIQSTLKYYNNSKK